MRISGINIPENKRIEIGLSYLYGIGRKNAATMLKAAGVDGSKKPKDVTQEEENSLRREIEKVKIEGDLKREIASNVKRHKDIKTYRGVRHLRKLPVRGQRTKTNSRTVRGNVRRTMGSGRKKVEKT
jgi:small subunit ribosomal protein S13